MESPLKAHDTNRPLRLRRMDCLSAAVAGAAITEIHDASVLRRCRKAATARLVDRFVHPALGHHCGRHDDTPGLCLRRVFRPARKTSPSPLPGISILEPLAYEGGQPTIEMDEPETEIVRMICHPTEKARLQRHGGPLLKHRRRVSNNVRPEATKIGRVLHPTCR